MTKITLNNDYSFSILEYNRYTNIEDGRLVSNATFRPENSNSYDTLVMLSQDRITDIRLSTDDVEIYHLANQNAKIVSIAENLYDGNLSISVTISFSYIEPTE